MDMPTGDPIALRLVPLVADAARGDAGAFSRLVEETRGVVCAITLAITRDVTASEDVAQDVYLHAWQGLPHLRNAASFLPWLRELARNRARMAVRAAVRRRQREAPPHEDTVLTLAADPAPDALAGVLDAESRVFLAESLAAIPDSAREVLVLYYREERSVRQVAELLGVTPDAVKQRLQRARQVLRAEYLARAGEVLGRTAPGATFAAGVAAAVVAGATPGVASAAALGGSSLALTTGAAAKVGGKFGVGAAGGAVLAGAVAGLGSGLLGLAAGTRRLLAAARTDDERRAIQLAGIAQASALTAFMVVLLGVEDLRLVTLAYALLLAGCAWLHFAWLPRRLARGVQRSAVRGFVVGAALGALPFAVLWWRALAGGRP
jgi:RNA polymerase sigma factor (sigma-70 family)